MKTTKTMLLALALMVLAQTLMTPPAQAQVLTGDQRLACEALLCLAAGANAPRECSNALAKYAALQAQTALQTLALRKNFLQLCPKRNALGAWEGERR
ncbi:MAG: TrbM/KikA/MpfK family conjugal transfer protein [Nitrospira sp.]|nr:TrbM/KikA/MpfK family conjugal transfer protein [Nitrospira sp.]HRA95369.1 TrbM/KikA/MpfK family conjugal transfer protein [Nitrospira sp.]